MHLQPFDLNGNVIDVVQKDRDRNQSAQLRWDAFCQIQRRQGLG